MDIERALRDLEIAELMEACARDELLPFFLATHPGFVDDWFHIALCRRLERFVADVEARRFPCLIVQAPPQHGKSVIVSRALQAWIIGKYPDWPLALASYAASLAAGHGRWIRNTIDTTFFKNVFPDCILAADSAAKDFFHTMSGGQFRAIGMDGGLSGQPARILTVDDPYRDMDEADSLLVRESRESWWESVAMARMAEGGGKLVMTTRWRTDDLPAKLIERGESNPKADQWDVFSFPAIAEQIERDDDGTIRRNVGDVLCPRVHSLEDLSRKRAGMTPRTWMAMYQQSPVADVGGYFERNWLRSYDATPAVGETFVAADLAYRENSENDNSAIAAAGETKGGDLVFLPGVIHRRQDTAKSVEDLIDLGERYRARVLVAGRDMITGSIGPFLKKRMAERNWHMQIIERPETKDLQVRARSYQARCSTGHVLWPGGEFFNTDVVPVHLSFPGTARDDLISMASNACWRLDQTTKPSETKTPEAKPDFQRRLAEIRKRTERPSGFAPLFGDGAR